MFDAHLLFPQDRMVVDVLCVTPSLKARESIDDMIWDTIQNKLDNLGKVLDGKEDSLKVGETREGTREGSEVNIRRPSVLKDLWNGAGRVDSRCERSGTGRH